MMNKEKNFYRSLPGGYTPVKTVDAKSDKKLIVFLNLGAVLLMLLSGFICFILRFGSFSRIAEILGNNTPFIFPALTATWIIIFLYLFLHELIHGAAYKIMTGQKLTFGITLTVAYCGVPDIYVTRKTALVSLLAPFTLFSAVFIFAVAFLPDIPAMCASVLFAVHAGGCAGDLYDAVLLIFGLKGKLLMNDTGPKQTFYIKKN